MIPVPIYSRAAKRTAAENRVARNAADVLACERRLMGLHLRSGDS